MPAAYLLVVVLVLLGVVIEIIFKICPPAFPVCM